jgi:hypothetical protein
MVQSKFDSSNDSIDIILHLVIPQADIVPLWDDFVPQ